MSREQGPDTCPTCHVTTGYIVEGRGSNEDAFIPDEPMEVGPPQTRQPGLSWQERADLVLAEGGMRLHQWQPRKCGAFGGACPWPKFSHDLGDLVPPHEWQPVDDGPVRYVLHGLP